MDQGEQEDHGHHHDRGGGGVGEEDHREDEVLPRSEEHVHGGRIKAVIPEKADQAANRKKKGRRGGRPVGCDAALYKDRDTVERCINKFKEWRGLATRYDNTPESYEAGLHLRGCIIWLRCLPALS